MSLEQACNFISMAALPDYTVAGVNASPRAQVAQNARRVFKIDGVDFTPLHTDCLIRICKGHRTIHAKFAPPGTEFDWYLDDGLTVLRLRSDCSVISGYVPKPWEVKGEKVSDLPDDFSIVLAKWTKTPTT
ncbi:hypothetical protein PspLS_03295 [Pyricularia sp. CBS 133598]|nr:hypothetical protein PspLS_03295 [Pyricularia sp. CBS 133598]